MALILRLKVVPRALRAAVAGWRGDRLKVTVTVPPEKGRANAAVIVVLAAALGIPRSRVRITAGASTPLKTVEVDADDSVLSRLPPR